MASKTAKYAYADAANVSEAELLDLPESLKPNEMFASFAAVAAAPCNVEPLATRQYGGYCTAEGMHCIPNPAVCYAACRDCNGVFCQPSVQQSLCSRKYSGRIAAGQRKEGLSVRPPNQFVDRRAGQARF